MLFGIEAAARCGRSPPQLRHPEPHRRATWRRPSSRLRAVPRRRRHRRRPRPPRRRCGHPDRRRHAPRRGGRRSRPSAPPRSRSTRSRVPAWRRGTCSTSDTATVHHVRGPKNWIDAAARCGAGPTPCARTRAAGHLRGRRLGCERGLRRRQTSRPGARRDRRLRRQRPDGARRDPGASRGGPAGARGRQRGRASTTRRSRAYFLPAAHHRPPGLRRGGTALRGAAAVARRRRRRRSAMSWSRPSWSCAQHGAAPADPALSGSARPHRRAHPARR